MPENSFLIVDESICTAFWSEDIDLYNDAEKLRLYIAWRNNDHNALILKQDWESFREKIKDKAEEISNPNEREKCIKEMNENLKSFISTQRFYNEDLTETPRNNLIILTNGLSELGNIIVISNDKTDKEFDSSIGKSKVYSLNEFIKLINVKYPAFYDYITSEFFTSSA